MMPHVTQKAQHRISANDADSFAIQENEYCSCSTQSCTPHMSGMLQALICTLERRNPYPSKTQPRTPRRLET